MNQRLEKLTPFKDNARRRMIMKGLTSVAILPGGRGANPEAHVTFFKSAEKQARKRPGESDEDFRRRVAADEGAEKQARRRRKKKDGDYDKEADDLEKGAGDLVDLVTSVNEGHQHGISVNIYDDQVSFFTSYAGQDRDSTHDHQIVRNDDGSYSILENFGHSHDDIPAEQIMSIIGQRMLEKEAAGEEMPEEGPLADLLAMAKESERQPPEGDPKMADDNKELDALKAQVATLTAVAALTGAHKTHYDALDEDGQAEFMKMDDAAKDAAIKAAETQKSEADPVVYTADNGDVFKQSDDPRLVKMAKERDSERKENIRLQKKAEDDALTKRAETELANLPGDLSVRKALLKAAESIEDETARTGAIEALKAQNSRMGGAFTTVGAGGTPAVKADSATAAEAELERLAKERASKESEDFYTAYEKVSEANPDLLKKAMG